MFPSHANIFFAPLTHDKYYKEKITFWTKVYDVDMSVLM